MIMKSIEYMTDKEIMSLDSDELEYICYERFRCQHYFKVSFQKCINCKGYDTYCNHAVTKSHLEGFYHLFKRGGEDYGK